MLTPRIYDDALRLVGSCRPLWESLAERGQRQLAGELKRSASSVALNVAEAVAGDDRSACLEAAMGSTRKTIACLDVGVGVGALGDRSVRQAVAQAGEVLASLHEVSTQ